MSNMNNWENWEIPRTTIVKSGRKSICILGCKIKAIFLLNIFFATVELDFEPFLGQLALLYLSWNIDVQKIMLGPSGCFILHPVFLLYKKRRKAIINKLHLNIFLFSFICKNCVLSGKVWWHSVIFWVSSTSKDTCWDHSGMDSLSWAQFEDLHHLIEELTKHLSEACHQFEQSLTSSIWSHWSHCTDILKQSYLSSPLSPRRTSAALSAAAIRCNLDRNRNLLVSRKYFILNATNQ